VIRPSTWLGTGKEPSAVGIAFAVAFDFTSN
jgi:hypothetical protein